MRDQKQRQVSRQAYAGLLWSKQFYYYVIEEWLKGDSTQPPPPASRLKGRNFEWLHLFNMDIISMPDKWEYPWVIVQNFCRKQFSCSSHKGLKIFKYTV